jgi:hypothetical protein
MMRKTALIVAAVSLVSLAGRTAAGFGVSDKGTSGAQFLKIAPSARPAGMGEAFAGVADDVNALYYNPAGIGTLKRVEVAGSHTALFQGINYEHAAVVVPLLSWVDTKQSRNAYGVMGLAIYNLSVSDIERRGTTETDAATETFGSSDFAYALSYGYQVPDSGLSLGVTGKGVDTKLDSAHGSAFAADAGLLYRSGRAGLGLGVRNLGTKQKIGTASDPLPMVVFTGVGYKFSDRFLASAEVDAPRDDKIGVGFGAEYRKEFVDRLGAAVRAGYNSKNTDAGGMAGLSFGIGLRYSNFDFDFALVPFGDLGNAYKYSLQVKF